MLPEGLKVGFKRTDKVVLPEVTLEKNKASEPAPIAAKVPREQEKQLAQSTVQKNANSRPLKESSLPSGAKLFRRGFAHEQGHEAAEDSKAQNHFVEKKASGEKIAVSEGKSAKETSGELKPTIHMQPPGDQGKGRGRDGNFGREFKGREGNEDSRQSTAGQRFKDRPPHQQPEGKSSGLKSSQGAKPTLSGRGPQQGKISSADQQSDDEGIHDQHNVPKSGKHQSQAIPSTTSDSRANFTKTTSGKRHLEDDGDNPQNDNRRKHQNRNGPYHPANKPAPSRKNEASQQEEYVVKEPEIDRKHKPSTGSLSGRPERKIDFGDNPFQLLNPK